MAQITKIEWADSTFNPWTGCTKVSPACDHCYAESWAKRSGTVKWGNHPRRRTTEANWREPLKWQRQAAVFRAEHGRRRRVFCASLADVFDNQVDPQWRTDLFKLVRATPDLVWLLLTKRPQNIVRMAEAADGLPPNAAIGTTIEDQRRADINGPHLHEAGATLKPLFLFYSIEPMLELIDPQLINAAGTARIGWIIAGGESGHHARPIQLQWARSLRDQCQMARVPFLFKQWGEYEPTSDANGPYMMKASSKQAAGRLLDGVEHNGFPEVAL